MAPPQEKAAFLEELRSLTAANVARTQGTFLELDDAVLTWKPKPAEWNILECFDHLNKTYEYYRTRIDKILATAPTADPARDGYRPTRLGRIYMFFSFNPRFSFPAAKSIAPATGLTRHVLDEFLANQAAYRDLLDQVQPLDLTATRVPLEPRLWFNLGDCLKILPNHDHLHLGQAQRVLDAHTSQEHTP